ncbi:F0F1 ATP synthase subunit gamma [Roseiconus nitratireducens]|uniref:F0F1 ATP synthase subunit gamma n=1 Tax=Roseiconus nitratireducens TaxID=2605748 RepID=A0A5M6DFB3_9BACT|nr:FoF1 ATP synthase subunit gamma [Roseiconus nitratireducens]KAA5546237.1 F0F1 ATP synthase subunit gamma [Roseiconus nitratireducens]
MKREQAFRHRLQTLEALHEAVGAMRSLSAHHFRLARKALPAAREYRKATESIVAEVGIRPPLHVDGATGLLVVASDLGLCGDYNTRISELAVSEANQFHAATIYSVGRRARAVLQRHGFVPERVYDSPASLSGLPQLLLELAQNILDDYSERRIHTLRVVSAAFEGVGHFQPLSIQVLPIDPVTSMPPLPPSPYVDADHLVASAIREFLYITLYEVLLDAVAAEHGMRLMAAESAMEWLENTSSTTARRLAGVRSEASTQELLDIVAGGRRIDEDP